MENPSSINLESIFPLFNKVPNEIQENIKNISILKDYSSKSTIFSKHEPLKYLYLIVSGTIHVVKEDRDGKEQIVSILRRGDFFPHIGIFEKNPISPGTAYVIERATLFLVPLFYFQDIALKYPAILMEYSKVLSKKIIELQNRLEEKAFYNTYQQIVRRILFLANQYGKRIEDSKIQLTISLTHEELAHLVGTTRETVSRTVTKLKKIQALNINQSLWTIDEKILKEQTNEL